MNIPIFFARDEQEYIISTFPDIGMKIARRQLAYFGWIQAIPNASLEDVVAIKGIREKTAQQMFELCRKVYG